MRHVLVDHDAVEHARVLELAAGHLLDLGVALDVDRLGAVLVARDGADGLERELAHHVGPPRDELGADRRLDQAQHLVLVARVDRDRNRVDDAQRLLERALERRDDDDRVDVALEVRERLREDLTSCERCEKSVSDQAPRASEGMCMKRRV